MPTSPSLSGSPTLLIILDGFGLNPNPQNNAVVKADTPNFDRYFDRYPSTALAASGTGVGLPEGQMGNSEVGHMIIGSGMILKQDLVRIHDAIDDGSFFENAPLLHAVQRAKAQNRPVHFIGLVSDGGVHSHIRHLHALIQLCQQQGVVAQLHMITDGRDTAPQAAQDYLPELEARLEACGGHIGTIMGRYYALDRDQHWDRIQLAWAAIVQASGKRAETAADAISESYAAGLTDEFIKPVLLPKLLSAEAGDEIIFFNFRNDRARQMAAAIAAPAFTDFDRGSDYQALNLTCLTHYDDQLQAPVAFTPVRPPVTLSGLISAAGLRQLHCAETEKYPHVTFFFNGGRETPFVGEEHRLIASPRVATYDLQPEMSAAAVADTMIDAIDSKDFDFLLVNFANGDMVGHTAVPEAIIRAVEVLDYEVGRVVDAAIHSGYSVILSSDHGNCDQMVDSETGKPHTQHSLHPVPCLVIDAQAQRLVNGASLSAIAPTVLQLLGLEKPAVMDGSSLIRDNPRVESAGDG